MRARRRSGVLLAGGSSTRFGSPKGLAACAGARLANHPLAALHQVCDEVLVVANDAAAPTWFPQHRVVTDVYGIRGGLSALASACAHAAHETVVVCAWDMPFVTAALLDALATAVDDGEPCCVPAHADGTLEPLCAAYAKTSSVNTIATLLAGDGSRAAFQLAHALHAASWPIATHLNAADAERIFFNVNTTDDLVRAAAWPTSEVHS